MRMLLALGVVSAALAMAGPAPASDVNVAGDPWPAAAGFALAPCTDDIYCGEQTLTEGFIADGEWNSTTNQMGFVTTINSIIVIDPLCAGVSATDITGPDFPGPLTRAFAWGIQDGDSWVGTWYSASGPVLPKLYHLDATFNVIGTYAYPDPLTGLDMQFSGLAMDPTSGHLWGILRNNPSGTISRFVEFDVNVDPPVLLQGPIDTPWPGGPSAVSSAGLEYSSADCTILAMRQDTNNLGNSSFLVKFQDVDPLGTTGGVSLLGDCTINNTPCTGAGQSSNRPWGIALIEGDPSYIIYSDLNLDVGCATPEQPIDFHIIAGPPFTGVCLAPVEPSTWGQIKSRYSN